MDTGIYPGLGMKEYHGWKLDKENLIEGPISCSMLKQFDENPYAWLKSGEMKQTEAMKLGSLYDAALTDPDALDDLIEFPKKLEDCEILPFDDLKTKAAREWKKKKESEGFRVLKQSERDKERADYKEAFSKAGEKRSNALIAAAEVHAHPIAGRILKGAEFQVGIIGEIGGIPAKCLLDILPAVDGEYSETLFDYKVITTGIGDESIRRAIGKFKYHWQAAFYRTMANKVSEDRVFEDFGFIFQCATTHEVRVVMLSEDSLVLGNRAVGRAVRDFRVAADKGIESRYLNKSESVDLMPYHAMNEDECLTKRELEEEAV